MSSTWSLGQTEISGVPMERRSIPYKVALLVRISMGVTLKALRYKGLSIIAPRVPDTWAKTGDKSDRRVNNPLLTVFTFS